MVINSLKSDCKSILIFYIYKILLQFFSDFVLAQSLTIIVIGLGTPPNWTCYDKMTF